MIYKIVAVGKLKEPHYKSGADEYIKRIGGMAKIEVAEIAPSYLADESHAAVSAALLKESAALTAACAGYEIIPLCIDGRQYGSEEFAALLRDLSVPKIAFVIGGSHGLAKSFTDGCGTRLSLSKMTLPHELARVVLLEQLYRAECIAGGKKYHK